MVVRVWWRRRVSCPVTYTHIHTNLSPFLSHQPTKPTTTKQVKYKITSRRISVVSGVGGKDLTEVIYPDIARVAYVFRCALGFGLGLICVWAFLFVCGRVGAGGRGERCSRVGGEMESLCCVVGRGLCERVNAEHWNVDSHTYTHSHKHSAFGTTGDMVLFLRDGAKLEMRCVDVNLMPLCVRPSVRPPARISQGIATGLLTPPKTHTNPTTTTTPKPQFWAKTAPSPTSVRSTPTSGTASSRTRRRPRPCCPPHKQSPG